MFKSCGVIGSKMSSSSLKENVQILNELAKEIFCNLGDRNMFTFNFPVLDQVARGKRRFVMLNYFDDSPYKYFFIETSIRMISIGKIVI